MGEVLDMDVLPNMEALINRARNLISSNISFGAMDDNQAQMNAWLTLIESGEDSEDAFLAVKAGLILLRDNRA